MSFRILKIKTITKFQPHYFFKANRFITSKAEGSVHYDEVDLGNVYWNWIFRRDNLIDFFLRNKQKSAENNRISLQIDQAAIRSITRACDIIRKVEHDCPDGREMWVAFRILSRCAQIASANFQDFTVHLSQGLLPRFNYYSLDENLRQVDDSPTYKFIQKLIDGIDFVNSYDLIEILVRNDSEFHQILSVAKILKRKFSSVKIILCTQGGNEQLDFGAWIDVLSKNKREIKKFIDYYIPRQDYNHSLTHLIKYLQGNSNQVRIENLIDFSNEEIHDSAELSLINWKGSLSNKVTEKEIDEAFIKSNWQQVCFNSDGLNTIAIRLSNERCHWAACDFCTINSQHLLKKGNKSIDSRIEYFIKESLDLIEAKRIQSVIFTDEALHPKVLRLFAVTAIERGLEFVYRARARFTEDFYDDNLCKLLYLSGLRYLGCGLESASPRINKLVNKHMGRELDYDRILNNLDTSGIRPHIYSITNFPTETHSEIEMTRNFLIQAIERYQYVTVSPNIFYLMRGSRIEENPDKYNISKFSVIGDLSLTLTHDEPEALKNKEFAQESIQKVHLSQFAPWLNNGADAESFWYFIDQTGIFYIQKVKFPINPYRTLYDCSLPPHDELLDLKINTKDTFLLKNSDVSFIISDWATFNYCEFDIEIFSLFNNWDEDLTVKENLEKFCTMDNITILEYAELVSQLIKEKIFSITINEPALI